MQFVKHITPKGLSIPAVALYLGNFEPGEKAEYHVQEDAVIILKKHMTAAELLHAAQALHNKATDLYACLDWVCGHCREDCVGCDSTSEDLEDLSLETLEMFLNMDICVDELVRHLQEGDIIYGA